MPPKVGYAPYSETHAGCGMTDDEWEFLKAVAAYQKRWNRRYPSWREVLHVARALGYRKVAPPDPFCDPLPGEAAFAASARAGKHEIRSTKSEPGPPDSEPAAG